MVLLEILFSNFHRQKYYNLSFANCKLRYQLQFLKVPLFPIPFLFEINMWKEYKTPLIGLFHILNKNPHTPFIVVRL